MMRRLNALIRSVRSWEALKSLNGLKWGGARCMTIREFPRFV